MSPAGDPSSGKRRRANCCRARLRSSYGKHLALRAELDKVQKQAEKLYKENLELRNQVERLVAHYSIPPPLLAVQIPPPIELPRFTFQGEWWRLE